MNLLLNLSAKIVTTSKQLRKNNSLTNCWKTSDQESLKLYQKNAFVPKKKQSSNDQIGLPKDKQNSYKILSIDGGGVRGLLPALWLAEIEKGIHRPLSQVFDMVSGVSTGAIIALGLSVCGKTSTKIPRYSALDIVNLFMEKANNIFTTKSSWTNLFS